AGLVNRSERPQPFAHRAPAFGLHADDSPGLVYHVHDGQMEGIAKVDVAGDLLGCELIHPAAVVFRIVGEKTDRVAVEPGEPDYARPAPSSTNLENAADIEYPGEQLTHVVH